MSNRGHRVSVLARPWALGFLCLLILASVEPAAAQERFFATPNRSGADGARQATQLQTETNRGIAHQISITAIEGNVGNLSSRMGTAESSIGALQTNVNGLTTRMGTAEGNISTLQSEMSNVKPHASAIMPGTCNQTGAKLRWNTTSNNWECVAEGDPTVRDFAKNDLPVCGSNQLLRSNGSGFTCVQAGSDYVAAELDPKIGATTSNKLCRGTGSQVVCDQDAPAAAETDPQVGAVTSGRWCRGDGTSIQCDQNPPSGSGGTGGGGILATGSRDGGSAEWTEETITITQSATVVFTGYGYANYSVGSISNAGNYLGLYIGSTHCATDMSFEGESATINFHSSATCVRRLSPGTYTLRSHHYVTPVGVTTRFQNRLSYTVIADGVTSASSGGSGVGLAVVASGTTTVPGSSYVTAVTGLPAGSEYTAFLEPQYSTASCGYIYPVFGKAGDGSIWMTLWNNATCGGAVKWSVVRMQAGASGGTAEGGPTISTTTAYFLRAGGNPATYTCPSNMRVTQCDNYDETGNFKCGVSISADGRSCTYAVNCTGANTATLIICAGISGI